jgi:hypothetical protein
MNRSLRELQRHGLVGVFVDLGALPNRPRGSAAAAQAADRTSGATSGRAVQVVAPEPTSRSLSDIFPASKRRGRSAAELLADLDALDRRRS